MTLEENELRIGNYYEWEDEIYQIEDSYSLYEKSKIINELKPIKLTPKWLEKFEFEKELDNIEGMLSFDYSLEINDLFIHSCWDLNGSLKFLRLEGCWGLEIKYVHQFQNLYFSLTGKEINQ